MRSASACTFEHSYIIDAVRGLSVWWTFDFKLEHLIAFRDNKWGVERTAKENGRSSTQFD